MQNMREDDATTTYGSQKLASNTARKCKEFHELTATNCSDQHALKLNEGKQHIEEIQGIPWKTRTLTEQQPVHRTIAQKQDDDEMHGIPCKRHKEMKRRRLIEAKACEQQSEEMQGIPRVDFGEL